MQAVIGGVIAVMTLVVLGALIFAAIWKASNAEERTKYVTPASTLLSAVIGGLIAYYFTHTEVTTAQDLAASAQKQAVQARAQLASLVSTATQARAELVGTIESKPVTYTVAELRDDNDYKMAVTKLNGIEGWRSYDDVYPKK
jgi:uncharacterized membrane protein